MGRGTRLRLADAVILNAHSPARSVLTAGTPPGYDLHRVLRLRQIKLVEAVQLDVPDLRFDVVSHIPDPTNGYRRGFRLGWGAHAFSGLRVASGTAAVTASEIVQLNLDL